uniref:Uncharacterized protein n=1 Tax=Rhizophora mucronata TaxID=61149 RepID=A0A2P2NSF0_RHIMU
MMKTYSLKLLLAMSQTLNYLPRNLSQNFPSLRILNPWHAL